MIDPVKKGVASPHAGSVQKPVSINIQRILNCKINGVFSVCVLAIDVENLLIFNPAVKHFSVKSLKSMDFRPQSDE